MKKIMKAAEAPATCSIDYAFRRIGGKYKGRILLYLSKQEIMRYGELRRHMSDITPKMLTQTLKELEEDELIHREAYREIPPRVEYSLTHMGHQLIPFIILLRDWGREKMESKGVACA
jgi:DNA-binding HxlR family transcriptional regulator